MINLLKPIAAIFCLAVSLYALLSYSFLTAGTTVHPLMKAVYANNLIAVYLHVFASLVALAIAPFQLSQRFRQRSLQRHRVLGKLYLCCVGIGGLASLWMAYIAFGGLVSQLGFALLGCAWLFTGYQGYVSIRRKDVLAHQRWMWVNVSLTFAAVTLRLYLGVFSALGVPFEAFYPAVSWLCWVPNVLVTEWFILKKLGLKP